MLSGVVAQSEKCAQGLNRAGARDATAVDREAILRRSRDDTNQSSLSRKSTGFGVARVNAALQFVGVEGLGSQGGG